VILAFVSVETSLQSRWTTGFLGLAILAAAVFCLAEPFRSLQALGFIIGLGWIFEGTIRLLSGAFGYNSTSRWITILTGILFLAAGIAAMILPTVALSWFVTASAIILIVLGTSTLLTMPRARGFHLDDV
jgi:uncharacterized membrane protein HdeD (DUF308 family)